MIARTHTRKTLIIRALSIVLLLAVFHFNACEDDPIIDDPGTTQPGGGSYGKIFFPDTSSNSQNTNVYQSGDNPKIF